MIEGVFIFMIMLVVGRILKAVKLPMTKSEKDRRIRVSGQIRRVCDKHRSRLQPGAMAVHDEANCDYCKMVEGLY